MQPVKSRKDFFAMTMTDDILEGATAARSRLTPIQSEFLKSALYEGYRKATGRKPRAMTPRDRNLKKTIVDNLQSSMADLVSYFHITRTVYQVPAWLGPKDVRRAISKEQIAELVEGLCSIGGKEYADSVLATAQSFYRNQGERVLIVRDASGFPA